MEYWTYKGKSPRNPFRRIPQTDKVRDLKRFPRGSELYKRMISRIGVRSPLIFRFVSPKVRYIFIPWSDYHDLITANPTKLAPRAKSLKLMVTRRGRELVQGRAKYAWSDLTIGDRGDEI